MNDKETLLRFLDIYRGCAPRRALVQRKLDAGRTPRQILERMRSYEDLTWLLFYAGLHPDRYLAVDFLEEVRVSLGMDGTQIPDHWFENPPEPCSIPNQYMALDAMGLPAYKARGLARGHWGLCAPQYEQALIRVIRDHFSYETIMEAMRRKVQQWI